MEQQGLEDGPIKEWWEGRFRRRANRSSRRNANKDKKSCDKQQKDRQGKPRCKINANKKY